MYQRSADLFLGVPFNITSTTLLLYIVAKLTNKKPDTVNITVIEDAAHCFGGKYKTGWKYIRFYLFLI